MTQVSLLPPRVDLLLYAGNIGTIVFDWDVLPLGPGWTATITAPGITDLDLDVDVAGTEVTVSIPDPSLYVNKTARLELALGGQVLVAGHVNVLRSAGTPSTQVVSVNTAAEVAVAVTVAGVPGAGLPAGGTTGQRATKLSDDDYDVGWETPVVGAVDSVNGETGAVVLDAADVGADSAGTAAGLVGSEATARANADTDEATARSNADAAHEADTTNIHGIADTALLETQSGAQAKVDAEATARDTAIQTAFANFIAGAPGSLDAWLELVAAIQADQSGLGALTTVVAGKETPAGAQAKADAAQAAAVQRANHTGTQAESTVAGLVADLAAKETPAGAQAKADAAQAAAVQRANHTGSQAESTVTGLVADLAAKVPLAGGTSTGKQIFSKGIEITDDDGVTVVNGYRALVFVEPPNADAKVVGLVTKIPGGAWGVGQGYGEGNYIVDLSDADTDETTLASTPVKILATITATTNATPVSVTATAHGFTTGDVVRVTGTGIGALDNKWWKVTRVDADHFTLDTSTAPGSTAAVGYAFSDRSPVLYRRSDTGLGTMGIHVAPGLRGRSGAALPAQAVWIDPSIDTIGLIIHNAPAAEWAPALTADFIQINDVRAGAMRFRVNAAGQTVHDPGTAALPGVTFEGDVDTGLYHVAANWLGLTTNGVIRLDMESTRLNFAEGYNIAFGTATGTKIGTAVGQKLAFYGTTPIAKQTGVPINAAGIHAACVALGLFAA